MKRRNPLRRKKRPNPVNPERKARMREGVYTDYHRWISTLPCLLWHDPDHWCMPGTVTGHHVRSVGAGGKDRANEVPACARCHREIHRVGRKTFEKRHGIDLEAKAQELAEEWDEREAA